MKIIAILHRISFGDDDVPTFTYIASEEITLPGRFEAYATIERWVKCFDLPAGYYAVQGIRPSTPDTDYATYAFVAEAIPPQTIPGGVRIMACDTDGLYRQRNLA